MANFNQSPLGQASVNVEAFSLTLGSSATDAPTSTSSYSATSDGSGRGDTIVPVMESIKPSWRRGSKIVSVND